MASVHLIRFPDRETRLRGLRAFYDVPVTWVRLPEQVMGVTDAHLSALKKAKIPFTHISKAPSRKGKHVSAVQP
jgi:hypothetical protein